MYALRFLLLLVHTITAAATPSSTVGCGSECSGTCFAGNCLFADNDVDDEDSFRSKKVAHVAAPGPVNPFGMGQAAQGMPPAPPQRYQPDFQQMSATATAGLSYGSMGVLENKAQELSFELQRAEAHEALLQAQNEQLRTQLQRWKETGANIAEREAKVVDLIAGSPKAQPRATSGAALVVPPTPPQPPSMLQRAARQIWAQGGLHQSYLGLFLTMCGVLIVAAFVWKTGCFVVRVRKGEVTWQSMSQAMANKPGYAPVLRAMGITHCKVEVSEIHLGSLFAGSSDIRVNFRMGSGIERRTKVLKNAGGSFLRFDDVLELSVCSSDAPCTICVTDRRGDLASVELPSSELVRLATRPHQEYFRTELAACSALGDVSDRSPYVAMRMRNIISTPVAPMAAGGNKAAAKGERAYGSFAV